VSERLTHAGRKGYRKKEANRNRSPNDESGNTKGMTIMASGVGMRKRAKVKPKKFEQGK